MTSKLEDEEEYWKSSSVKKFDFNFGFEEPISFLTVTPTSDNFQPQSVDKNDVMFSGMLANDAVSQMSSSDGDPSKDFVVSARFRQNSIADSPSVLKDFVSSNAYTATHVAKLKSEINQLKQRTTTPPSFKDVVNQIINDEYYSLEDFRSRENKVGLIDAAIRSHDGNAILRTVLHLKNTTNPKIFQQELRSRPDAIEHYLTYLRLHCKYPELIDVLGMFCRNEEAAMVTYQMAISNSHTETTIKLLQNCKRTHFNSEPKLHRETILIQDHINLLEKQLPIEKRDCQLEKEGKTEIFQKIPRTKPLTRQSVLNTLYYCCLYHYDLAENNFASPLAMKRDHNLTNKQYIFTALSALAELEDWRRMDSLVFSKGGFTKSIKLKPEINMMRLTEMLVKKNSPPEVLSKYIEYVDDLEQRLEFAKRFMCHELVIETLTSLRDREQLFRYKNKLPAQSKEWLLADQKLRLNIKWKK